jgi:hypothetical protein
MTRDELWSPYCQYLEEGDPAIPAEDRPVACMSWEEFKKAGGFFDEPDD